MSWIALTDTARPAFNPQGIGAPPDRPGTSASLPIDAILAKGTLVFELRHHGGESGPRRLITFHRSREWHREIAIEIDSHDRLSLQIRQGAARSRAMIDLRRPEHDSRLRVSYTWDAPRRVSTLTVEYPDERRVHQAIAGNPVPLPLRDVKELVRNGSASEIGQNVRFVASSDKIEPVGLGTGIAAGSTIETAQGPVPIDRLRLGDEVLTAGSGYQPVRWIARRTVPALGGFRPVRIRAPFFGLENDMIAAPDHRVRLELAEAEYMLGDDEVLIPAATLVNGRHAQRDARHRLVTYYQVLLDVHDCLLHDGLWAESLFVGTISRHPTLARSTVLSGMPHSAIPVHRTGSPKLLSPFETRSLAATLQIA